MLAAQSSPVSGIAFGVAVLATSAALVAGLAWASRRLLGLPVGTVRAFIAGALGFVAAELLGRSLRAAQPGHLAAFFTVALGVPLIVAMIFIVVAEALVPTGTGPHPVEIVRGARRSLAQGAIGKSPGSPCGTVLAHTCAVSGCTALTAMVSGRHSRCPCAVPWKKAGLPSPSWASCCPLAVICSRRSSSRNSPSCKTAPSQHHGSR
jgi:hypothetical protein